MTDLTQAIAELREMDMDDGGNWTAEELRRTAHPNDLNSIATILNAAVSGELIPLADHKLAVAEALRKAAVACEDVDFVADDPSVQRMVREAISFAGSRVLSLAPTDALAEVREWKRLAIGGNLVALEMRQVEARAEAAEVENARLTAQVERLMALLSKAGMALGGTFKNLVGDAVFRCDGEYYTVPWLKKEIAALIEGAKP